MKHQALGGNENKLKEAILDSNRHQCQTLLSFGAHVQDEHLKLAVRGGNLIICNLMILNYSQPYTDALKQELMDIAKAFKHPQLWLLLKQYNDGDDEFMKPDRTYTCYYFYQPSRADTSQKVEHHASQAMTSTRGQ